MVARDHGIPMVSLTAVKTAVNLPCGALKKLEKIVRFLNGTVYGSSRPRYTHGKPYRGKNRGKFTVWSPEEIRVIFPSKYPHNILWLVLIF